PLRGAPQPEADCQSARTRRSRTLPALPKSGRGASDPVERRKLLVRDLDRRGADVLLEMGDLAGAGNQQHDGAALEQPGERDLAGARLVLPGDRVERRAFARERAGAERGPWDEANAARGAIVERRFARAIGEVVAV